MPDQEWIKTLEDGRRVKFIYQELPEDGAFITAQIAGNEVVYSVVLTKAGNPLGREDVESHFKRELSRRRQCRSLEKHGDFLRDFRGEPFIPQPLNSCTSSEFSMSSWCFSTFCRN